LNGPIERLKRSDETADAADVDGTDEGRTT